MFKKRTYKKKSYSKSNKKSFWNGFWAWKKSTRPKKVVKNKYWKMIKWAISRAKTYRPVRKYTLKLSNKWKAKLALSWRSHKYFSTQYSKNYWKWSFWSVNLISWKSKIYWKKK